MKRQLISVLMDRYRSPVIIVVACSILLNVLALAGALYMLLVYDSVLPSQSIPTLLGLLLMLCVIYVFQFIFETIRSKALITFGNGFHADLFKPVHRAATRARLSGINRDNNEMQPVRDLDQIYGYLISVGPAAIIDLPWMVLFLIVLTLLHWTLGLTAFVGILVLCAIAYFNNRRTVAGTRDLAPVMRSRMASAQIEVRFAESAAAMGMTERLLNRTQDHEQRYLTAQAFLATTAGRFGSAGRVFRLVLQSLILTVGALLVIDGKATGGVIIASSVLAGRALAPIDQALSTWRGLTLARAGWERLVGVIATPSRASRDVTLPSPRGSLTVTDLWIAVPGIARPIISGVSFVLEPGNAMAIVGPSAAGKTTLSKALAGIIQPSRGELRIGGATYDQWDPEAFGANVGYVPQTFELIEGTIGQNIARFDPAASSEAVIAAAQAAGVHEIVLALADGYDTEVTTGGPELSAGQRQRVGLAQALFGDPFLVVLDEPNSNLDSAGDAALDSAIRSVRERKGIVVLVTHRPATLGPISHVGVLNGGKLMDFGARDEVMGRINKPASKGLSGTHTERGPEA